MDMLKKVTERTQTITGMVCSVMRHVETNLITAVVSLHNASYTVNAGTLAKVPLLGLLLLGLQTPGVEKNVPCLFVAVVNSLVRGLPDGQQSQGTCY